MAVEPSHRRFRSGSALRLLDIVLVIVAAPLWVPAMAALAVGVVLSSGRPVFFRQVRVGRNGETFEMTKFRSMKTGDNPLMPNPDRITKIGHALRRTSLDELPQILNVLAGSMSLVGPRPMLPAQLGALNSSQLQRLDVRPGMTGLAQVSGRNALSWDERFVFDLRWTRFASVGLYMEILFKTIKTVTTGAGVTGHDATDRVVALDLDTVDLDTVDLDATSPAMSKRAA
jgi:lipopolysaccharide/colanic/teichoic acid biosynthesis glycosyltransferase